MSWSYTGPSSGTKDHVRFLVGDTAARQPFLQDEEIVFLLNENDHNVNLTAIEACEAILSKLARSRDETVGSLSISFSQQYNGYMSRLSGLRRKLAYSDDIIPYAGGISLADKALAYQNRDWPRPDFSRNMMLSPWALALLERQPTVDWSQWPLG